jgi:Tfp pilus assembly protein PilO
MALLPQEPKQQRALLALVLAIAAAGLFWNYWETPERAEIAAATERVEALEAQNQAARIAAARGEEGLAENLATFERHIARLEELMPREQDLPALISDLNLEADRLDLDAISLFTNPPQPGVAYTRQTYDMSWAGAYHDIGRFLASIASLERIITPIQLQLSVPDDPADFPDYEAPVLAEFTISTYVLPAPGQAPAIDSTTVEGG